MKITITNTDEQIPVILRIMRRENGEEIDCLSEMQLPPSQETEIDITLDQSLTVMAR